MTMNAGENALPACSTVNLCSHYRNQKKELSNLVIQYQVLSPKACICATLNGLRKLLYMYGYMQQ